MASAWLEMMPRTSAEAGQQADRARWAGQGTLAFSLALEGVLIGLTGEWDGRLVVIGALGFVLLAALALVHRETYHRLKDAGR